MENKGDSGPSDTKQNNSPNAEIDTAFVIPEGKRANSDSQHASKCHVSIVQVYGHNEQNNHAAEKVNSFEDMPVEMLDEIFKSLTKSDLLNCRLVNRRCNEVSSRVMRARDDISLHFEFTKGKFVQRIHHQHCEQLSDSISKLGSKSLADLVSCMKDPARFPITSFRLDGLSNLEDIRNFLTIFGKEMRSLRVSLNCLKLNSEMLRKLIFEELPNLKVLGIGFWESFNSKSSRPLAASINMLQLPQLEVLYVDYLSEAYTEIMEAILMSSSNLKSIWIRGIVTEKDLQILHKTNRLHCVQSGYFIGMETIANWSKYGQLQLQSLNLRFFVWGNHQPRIGDMETINQLFQSIKGSLLSLTTEPIGSLTEYKLPKFEKLQKLCLRPDFGEQRQPSPSFLPPFNWADTFPNLKELEISFAGVWFDSTFQRSLTLPTLETLRITSGNRQKIAHLMKLTPNVKTLVIMDDGIVWYGDTNGMVNFKDISLFLPKLENFSWQMCIGTKDMSRIHRMYDFDAKITGLPVGLCKTLAAKMRGRGRNDLSAEEIAKYHLMRGECQASILDLKELKHFHAEFTFMNELSVEVMSDDSDAESELPKFDPECLSEISKVSKLLAFDFMPNLKVSAHKVAG